MKRGVLAGRARQVCVCMLAAWAILATPGALFGPSPAVSQSRSFSAIAVEGNQRIDDETIRVFAGIEPGQAVSAAEINAALQRLFETGLFEDVRIEPAGGRLLITVAENPTINIINFEGNQRIDDDTLSGVISLTPRRAYSRAAAEEDAAAIVEAYSRAGRFSATVTPRIIRLEDNRVNLVFEIFEGRVTEIQRISFTGNEAYSDRRLRRAIESGQAGFFSFLFRNDTYDQDRLELDKQRLREFYAERGYIDFAVRSASAEISRERNAFFLSFSLSEGEQYSFGEMTVSSFIDELDPAEFEALIDVRPGDVYKESRLETQIERMSFLAAQRGVAFIDIRPRVSRDDQNRLVNIDFELLPGERIFIERIEIRGNRETVDRVIRRQFRVVEGDAFNAREIRRAEQRIRALGFFRTVEVRVREGSAADRAVIIVDVEEAPTGNLSFGAAYSSTDGVAAQLSISERNFLGRGQLVRLDLSNGEDSTTAAFEFNEPALFDQDLSAGFSLYYRENDFDESSINTRNIGFEPRIGFPISENGRLTLRLRVSQDEIEVNDPPTTSPIILREEGTEIAYGAGFTYTLDRRNSPIDPSAGFIFRLDQDLIGGDSQYSKTVANARLYSSLLNEDVILSAEVEGGALMAFNDRSRITDRFVLGGDSFRGFARGGLGPRDRCRGCGSAGGRVNDALGGNLYAVARFEASFPIGLPEEYGIYGGVFADVGSLWDLYDTAGASGTVDDSAQLRSSVGLSIFWDTPIGPLRFNWANPIKTVAGDEEERFRITIDTRF